MGENRGDRRLDTAAVGREALRWAHDLPERLALLHGQRLDRAIGLVFLPALVFRYLDAISGMRLVGFIGAILAIATRPSRASRCAAASRPSCWRFLVLGALGFGM